MTDYQRHVKFETEEVSRHYRTELPNIVIKMAAAGLISNNALILYTHFRQIAGEDGSCWMGYRKLLSICHLSAPTFRKAKNELLKSFPELDGKSLIANIPGDRKLEEADTVVIIDIWKQNHNFFKNKLTWVKVAPTPGKNETPPLGKSRLHKKEPFKKNPINKSSSSRASSSTAPTAEVANIDDASGGDDDACGAKNNSNFNIDLAAGAGDVSVTKTNGQTLTMDQSAIFRHFLKKPFKTETVCEAIKRLRSWKGPVNNILHYLESMCKTIESEPVKCKKKSDIAINDPIDYTDHRPPPAKQILTGKGNNLKWTIGRPKNV